MIKIIITEEGKSNKPIAILTTETQLAIFYYWLETLSKNPDKYEVEVYNKIAFNKDCSETLPVFFADLCRAKEIFNGKTTELYIKLSFVGAIESVVFTQISKGKHV